MLYIPVVVTSEAEDSASWQPKLRLNVHRYADGIFTCFFVTSLFYFDASFMVIFPKGPFDNNSALVQIMARHWIGNKPLSAPDVA